MKKFFLFFIVSAIAIGSFGQTSEKQNISKAIQDGNAKLLGGYFTKTVDLTVKDIEGVYSKDQAEVILTRFFTENKTKSYSVKHEGKSKLDDYYYIGDLVTATGTYRLTFFLKKEGEIFRIKQLKIESED